MKKSEYWQCIRGICILAVIMIHCPSGHEIWLGIRQLINFPVAVFIFMAGYFVNPQKVDKQWLKKRWRLLIPYLLWNSVYSLKNVMTGINIKSVIYAFVFGQSAASLYYILVLLQLTLLTPYLINKRKNGCI